METLPCLRLHILYLVVFCLDDHGGTAASGDADVWLQTGLALDDLGDLRAHNGREQHSLQEVAETVVGALGSVGCGMGGATPHGACGLPADARKRRPVPPGAPRTCRCGRWRRRPPPLLL